MPPALAHWFTTGGLAVLTIVADAVRDNGQYASMSSIVYWLSLQSTDTLSGG
jgi:hypothetical protein